MRPSMQLTDLPEDPKPQITPPALIGMIPLTLSVPTTSANSNTPATDVLTITAL